MLVTRRGIEGVFWEGWAEMFCNLGPRCTEVFALWKFIKFHTYNLCTFLYVHYTSVKSKQTHEIGRKRDAWAFHYIKLTVPLGVRHWTSKPLLTPAPLPFRPSKTLCLHAKSLGSSLLGPGIEPLSLESPALAGRFFTTSAAWEALKKPNYLVRKAKYENSLSFQETRAALCLGGAQVLCTFPLCGA